MPFLALQPVKRKPSDVAAEVFTAAATMEGAASVLMSDAFNSESAMLDSTTDRIEAMAATVERTIQAALDTIIRRTTIGTTTIAAITTITIIGTTAIRGIAGKPE